MQRDRKGRWFLIYAPISGASLFLRQKCENAVFEERKRWEWRKRGRNEVVTQQKEADSPNLKKKKIWRSGVEREQTIPEYFTAALVLSCDLTFHLLSGDPESRWKSYPTISHHHIHQNLGFDTFLFFPLRSSLSHRKWKWNMHRLASKCAAWGSGWGPGPDGHGNYGLRIKGTLCTWGHLHCGSSTSVRRRSYMERKGGSLLACPLTLLIFWETVSRKWLN